MNKRPLFSQSTTDRSLDHRQSRMIGVIFVFAAVVFGTNTPARYVFVTCSWFSHDFSACFSPLGIHFFLSLVLKFRSPCRPACVCAYALGILRSLQRRVFSSFSRACVRFCVVLASSARCFPSTTTNERFFGEFCTDVSTAPALLSPPFVHGAAQQRCGTSCNATVCTDINGDDTHVRILLRSDFLRR